MDDFAKFCLVQLRWSRWNLLIFCNVVANYIVDQQVSYDCSPVACLAHCFLPSTPRSWMQVARLVHCQMDRMCCYGISIVHWYRQYLYIHVWFVLSSSRKYQLGEIVAQHSDSMYSLSAWTQGSCGVCLALCHSTGYQMNSPIRKVGLASSSTRVTFNVHLLLWLFVVIIQLWFFLLLRWCCSCGKVLWSTDCKILRVWLPSSFTPPDNPVIIIKSKTTRPLF